MVIKRILEQTKALKRTRRRLKRLNDQRVYDMEQCPYCLEIPFTEEWMSGQEPLVSDKHTDDCELAEELGDKP